MEIEDSQEKKTKRQNKQTDIEQRNKRGEEDFGHIIYLAV